ncbi:hypothetical protein L484_016995 [Morus notabilis]|uniref:DUF668 domain-containing protein n=1 Tax=Morus notabilis TaxID=981085 RepID=W9QG70_9ROSA|nr:uncharacterized protein LOC21400018 [Morus notabilis]EXB36743.1 hypothetical protein L484_016995 [Morus notabilis]
MAWLTTAGNSLYNILFQYDKKVKTTTTISTSSAPLGILCFEAAKMMSRLVSLYRSLSDDEFRSLKNEVVKSKGVSYLNSSDEDHLLRLACAELLEELDHVAAAVSRLGAKCSDAARGLLRFELLYADLKLGLIDPKKIEFRSRNVQRLVEKMERLVSVTANLYSVSESLAELEHSEKKIDKWKKNANPKQFGKTNFELFDQKIAFLRKQVQSYKEASLWSQTYDKSVGGANRMRRSPTEYCLIEDRDFYVQRIEQASKTSPIGTDRGLVRIPRRNPFSDGFDRISGCENRKNDGVSGLASQSTVGGSALTLRYANVIILAERCLYAPETVNDGMREELYEMLPENLRRTVRAKLKKRWMRKEEEDEGGRNGHALAEGWRDALEEIMTWLAPMGHDTMTWQTEKNLERQQCYYDGVGKPSSSSVLLMQTLHFSDLEKTEAAIVEVLVGLSCVFRYENRRRSGDHESSSHDHLREVGARFKTRS